VSLLCGHVVASGYKTNSGEIHSPGTLCAGTSCMQLHLFAQYAGVTFVRPRGCQWTLRDAGIESSNAASTFGILYHGLSGWSDVQEM
jgi:hypothetical protein